MTREIAYVVHWHPDDREAYRRRGRLWLRRAPKLSVVEADAYKREGGSGECEQDIQ
jgi:hypothetical protein